MDRLSEFVDETDRFEAGLILRETFIEILENIDDAQERLETDLDPRELTPIHDQLRTGNVPATAPVEIPWHHPFYERVIEEHIAEFESRNWYETLGFLSANIGLLAISKFTGGLPFWLAQSTRILSLGGSVGLTAYGLHGSWTHMGAMNEAAGSAVDPEMRLVEQRQAEIARQVLLLELILEALIFVPSDISTAKAIFRGRGESPSGAQGAPGITSSSGRPAEAGSRSRELQSRRETVTEGVAGPRSASRSSPRRSREATDEPRLDPSVIREWGNTENFHQVRPFLGQRASRHNVPPGYEFRPSGTVIPRKRADDRRFAPLRVDENNRIRVLRGTGREPENYATLKDRLEGKRIGEVTLPDEYTAYSRRAHIRRNVADDDRFVPLDLDHQMRIVIRGH